MTDSTVPDRWTEAAKRLRAHLGRVTTLPLDTGRFVPKEKP